MEQFEVIARKIMTDFIVFISIGNSSHIPLFLHKINLNIIVAKKCDVTTRG